MAQQPRETPYVDTAKPGEEDMTDKNTPNEYAAMTALSPSQAQLLKTVKEYFGTGTWGVCRETWEKFMKEAKPDTRLRVDSVLCAAGVTKVVDFSKQYYEMALLVVEAMLNTADEQGDGEATKLARIWFRPIQEMLNELGRDEKMVDIQLRKKVLEKKLQVASVEDESEAD